MNIGDKVRVVAGYFQHGVPTGETGTITDIWYEEYADEVDEIVFVEVAFVSVGKVTLFPEDLMEA